MACTCHWVGTLPFKNAREAMYWQRQAAGEYARYVGGGETGERRNWVVDFVNELRHNPAIAVVKPGRFRNYPDTPIYRVKRGHELKIELPYFDYVKEEWQLFQALRTQPGNEHLQFLVGMPDPYQIPFFTRLTKHYQVFEDATVEQVEKIHQLTDGDFTLQLEVPVHQILAYAAGSGGKRARAKMIRKLVAQLAGFIRRLPNGLQVAIHMCFGDLNNKALVMPWSMESTVDFLTALADVPGLWEEYDWAYAHVPVAFGYKPPKLRKRFYAAFARLLLPQGTELALGVAHEKASLADQKQVIDWLIELGCWPDMISCACGEARRRGIQTDAEQLALVVELAERKKELARYVESRRRRAPA